MITSQISLWFGKLIQSFIIYYNVKTNLIIMTASKITKSKQRGILSRVIGEKLTIQWNFKEGYRVWGPKLLLRACED